MAGLQFETVQPTPLADPNRVDIACFVGFVKRRPTRLPESLQRWLKDQGWVDLEYRRPEAAQDTQATVATLKDVPIPIDSWTVFDRLFAWEERSLADTMGRSDTYLGVAVRSFFAQGGQRCYVVRVDDPWPVLAPRATRLGLLDRLIPGNAQGQVSSHPLAPRSWSGIGHILGLPEVTFLSLPDLPDLVSVNREAPSGQVQPPSFPEQFVDCSAPHPPVSIDRPVQRIQAPQCSLEGYFDWANALNKVAYFLQQHRREIQLVASVPLPLPGMQAEKNLLDFLLEKRIWSPGDNALAILDNSLDNSPGIASAFVQLVYPWATSPAALNLPQQLENPEGVITGLLARNALQRGTFHSAANAELGNVFSVFPILSLDQQQTEIMADTSANQGDTEAAAPQDLVPHNLLEHVSLLGPTPAGLRLLSDVTTSVDPFYRPASVNRLVISLLRAARQLGTELVFESSGELLWGRIREALNGLLLGLYRAGALRGNTPNEAFQVRCDRSTMTQQDLDQGRVIAQVQFTPTIPIDQIIVQLVLTDSSQTAQLMPALAT